MNTYIQRQIGTRLSKGFLTRIRWESGRVERVRVDLLPPALLGLPVGSRFAAIVERDSWTARLLGLSAVARLGPVVEESDVDCHVMD